MALGNQNRLSGKSYPIKLKLKDGEAFLDVAYFEIQKKVGEKYEPITPEELEALTGSKDPLRDIEGNLVKISTRLGEYDGKPTRSYTLGLQDPTKGEVYYINVSLGSGVGRGLANSVLNLKVFNAVKVGLYGQKNQQTKKVYPAVALRQGTDTDTVKWKYDPKNPDSGMPPVREFEGRGGSKERDYTAQEIFLFERLNEFSKVVEASAKNHPASSAPKAVKSNPAADPATPPEADGDVPF
jgi:hypothetical protein